MLKTDDVIIMIDTETTNDIDCPIVYDVGYQVFTLDGELFCVCSFVYTKYVGRACVASIVV